MRGICIESIDAQINLAIEEYLFTTITEDDDAIFLLWQNKPSIIVGKHQNTVQEINESLIKKYNLPVIRRISGGGAVYHDLGNLNFSYIIPRYGKRVTDFSKFIQPITDTLKDLGVSAAFSSRNDITVAGKKISGSAQVFNNNKLLHHGTILFDLDLDMLGAVLTVSPDKYLSKGIHSVRSRVMNLREILPQAIGIDELKDALLRRCTTTQEALPSRVLARAHLLAEQKYHTWDWNYGASPPFSQKLRERFPWGVVEAYFDIRKGNISGCRIFGDFFAMQDIAALEEKFCGVCTQEMQLLAFLQKIAWEDFFAGCDAQRMIAFFMQAHVPASM